MERFFQIAKINLKHNVLPHLLIACIFLAIAPLLMGLENLDTPSSAKVLEVYVALIGIILLSPIFFAEQNKDIRELVHAKYTATTTVTIIRMLESGLLIATLIGLYVLLLRHNNCEFPMLSFYLGTLAEAGFLGAMGLMAYTIFDQIAIAYLCPIVYYMLAFGSGEKLLHDFHLFSMGYGSYHEKANLAIIGIAMILISFCYPYIIARVETRLHWHKI